MLLLLMAPSWPYQYSRSIWHFSLKHQLWKSSWIWIFMKSREKKGKKPKFMLLMVSGKKKPEEKSFRRKQTKNLRNVPWKLTQSNLWVLSVAVLVCWKHQQAAHSPRHLPRATPWSGAASLLSPQHQLPPPQGTRLVSQQHMMCLLRFRNL